MSYNTNRTSFTTVQPQLLFMLFQQHNGERESRLSAMQNTSRFVVSQCEKNESFGEYRILESDQGTIRGASAK